MMQKQAVPSNVLTAVNAMLEPYGYDTAMLTRPNPTEENTRIFVGSYDFHLKKINELWKIDMFKYNLKYLF